MLKDLSFYGCLFKYNFFGDYLQLVTFDSIYDNNEPESKICLYLSLDLSYFYFPGVLSILFTFSLKNYLLKLDVVLLKFIDVLLREGILVGLSFLFAIS